MVIVKSLVTAVTAGTYNAAVRAAAELPALASLLPFENSRNVFEAEVVASVVHLN